MGLLLGGGDLDEVAGRIRMILSGIDRDDAAAASLAVAAEKAISAGLTPERFAWMAETLMRSILIGKEEG